MDDVEPSATSWRDRAFLLVLALLLLAGIAAALSRGNPSTSRGPGVAPQAGETSGRAGAAALATLRYRGGDDDAYADRAAAGFAHPLYAAVPGGAVATARRVAQWRELVEEAADADGSPIDADTLEALVYLESAGRPDASATGTAAGAVGLTQIVGQTGRDLLKLPIDEARSDRLTRRISRTERLIARWKEKGSTGALKRGEIQLRALKVQRAKADPRYVPRVALAATVAYLKFARTELGRDDLALASYHMGVGNLQRVLSAYGNGKVSYVQLYFDTDPVRSPRAFRLLSRLRDDSSTYYFRVRSAKAIMRAYRQDPGGLARRAALATQKASLEDLMHPPAANPPFASPDEIVRALDDEELEPLPIAALNANGVAVSPAMGELAKRLDARKTTYRALRRGTLATLVGIGAAVRALSGGSAYLTVTSTVRDARYQRLLRAETVQATQGYSLHTSGWAFDVSRSYRSGKQAQMFQFVLTRMQALGLITWVREPEAIHITVAADAESRLGPLLEIALGRS